MHWSLKISFIFANSDFSWVNPLSVENMLVNKDHILVGFTICNNCLLPRLSELRDVLMDLRGKHETEQSERRNLEKLMQAK